MSDTITHSLQKVNPERPSYAPSDTEYAACKFGSMCPPDIPEYKDYRRKVIRAVYDGHMSFNYVDSLVSFYPQSEPYQINTLIRDLSMYDEPGKSTKSYYSRLARPSDIFIRVVSDALGLCYYQDDDLGVSSIRHFVRNDDGSLISCDPKSLSLLVARLIPLATQKTIKDTVYSMCAQAPRVKIVDNKYIAVNGGKLLLDPTKDINDPDFAIPCPEDRVARNPIYVTWDPNATDPAAEQFFNALSKVSYRPGARVDFGVRANIEEAGGLCLSAQHRGLVFLVGDFENNGPDAANGKSTICSVISSILGSNAANVKINQFESEYGLIKLRDKTAVIDSEVSSDIISKRATSIIKSLDSYGDTITSNVKYADYAEFKPYCTQIYASNTMPKFNRDDIKNGGIMRRIEFIRLRNRFLDGDPDYDPDLMAKLSTDSARSALLVLFIKGLQRYMANGNKFSKGDDSSLLKLSLQSENDTVVDFIYNNDIPMQMSMFLGDTPYVGAANLRSIRYIDKVAHKSKYYDQVTEDGRSKSVNVWYALYSDFCEERHQMIVTHKNFVRRICGLLGMRTASTGGQGAYTYFRLRPDWVDVATGLQFLRGDSVTEMDLDGDTLEDTVEATTVVDSPSTGIVVVDNTIGAGEPGSTMDNFAEICEFTQEMREVVTDEVAKLTSKAPRIDIAVTPSVPYVTTTAFAEDIVNMDRDSLERYENLVSDAMPLYRAYISNIEARIVDPTDTTVYAEEVTRSFARVFNPNKPEDTMLCSKVITRKQDDVLRIWTPVAKRQYLYALYNFAKEGELRMQTALSRIRDRLLELDSDAA